MPHDADIVPGAAARLTHPDRAPSHTEFISATFISATLETALLNAEKLANPAFAAVVGTLLMFSAFANVPRASASSEHDSGHRRPLFLEIPDGGGGPCGKRPPCQLIAMIDGQMRPGQMMRAPGENWKLWWFQQGPLVSGTKISAVSGRQGSGHFLSWHGTGDSAGSSARADLVLRERERDILRYRSSGAASGGAAPSYQLLSPDGSAVVTQGAGLFLDVSAQEQPLSQRQDEILRPLAGPVAGGHLVRLEWGNGSQERLVEETRLTRVFVLSDRDYLVQIDSLLHSRGDRDLDLAAAGREARWRLALAPHAASAKEPSPRPTNGWKAQGSSGMQVLRSAATIDLFAVANASAATLPVVANASPSPSWVAQRRRIGGQDMTFVVFADPRLQGTVSANEEGVSLTVGGRLPSRRHLMSTVRLWIVQGHEIGAGEIDEQFDAFRGASKQPSAEELRRREERTESPWG